MARGAERSGTWAGEAYAKHSGHHRVFDDWFLDRLPPEPDDVVVDLGCGSGEFTARLASLVPDGHVVGVDQDPSMIEQARMRVDRNMRFVQTPAQRVDEELKRASADLVVSRAMLHWLQLSQYPRVFEAVLRVLRPGGWFHSESAAAGNVAPVDQLLRDIAARFGLQPPTTFPGPEVVFEHVEAAGFALPDEAVKTVAQRRSFSRDELVAFLRSQAAVALIREAPDDDLAEKIPDALADGVDRLRRHDGTYDQTFVRLEILARRPHGE